MTKVEKLPGTKWKGVNSIVLPAIISVAVITQVPIIATLILSFIRWIVVRPDQATSFVGISNYMEILTTPSFYSIILNTVVMTLGSLVLCTVLGMFFAVLLNRSFPGVNVLRTIFIAPFFVMDAVAGIIWKTLILHPSFGINNVVAGFLGVPVADFLGHHPMATVIFLIVWQWTPFFFMIFLAGLESVPEEVVESATLDGADNTQILFRIKIPMIVHYLEVAVMLGLVFILKTFGTIYVTTAGGPGTSSMNLPFIVYRTAFYQWDVGTASAMAVITVILTILSISAVFKLFQKRAGRI